MKDEQYCYNSSHMSSHIVTVDSVSSVEAAADIIIQTKGQHLLVVNRGDINE